MDKGIIVQASTASIKVFYLRFLDESFVIGCWLWHWRLLSSRPPMPPLYINFIMNELGTYFGNQLGAIAVTAAALFGFGLAFNWLINLFNRHGLDDGFTWLLVVVGVGITVLAAGFTIGWTAVIVLFIYFAASGLPMAAGDIYRYAKARRAERYDKTA